MKARSVAWLLAVCVCSGCSLGGGAEEDVGRVAQAISGAQALEFESTSPWSPGGTTLATSSSVKTQGNASMRITTSSSWHELSAGSLSSVGAVGAKLGLDVRVDRQQPWGEVRAVVSIPSQQVWDMDIGGVSLVGRPLNQFFRMEFNLPTNLQTKLAGSYSDLTIRFRINAPAAVYHFDNGSFAPAGDGVASADIGATGATGSTALDGGTYTIQGSGSDIEDSADSFRFLYKSMNGDGQIVARVQDVTPTNDWTKVGVMVRDSLSPDSKNAFMLLRPSQGSAFQYRATTAGGTTSSWQDEPEDFSAEHNARYLRAPKWLKLTRQGNVLTAYSSDDGQCWWERWTEVLAFDDSQAYFGVALSAGGYGDLATAHVTNFAVQSTVEPHNASCPRAALDGDLPVPTSWIVPPGRFGGSNWSYTTTNPNGSPAPVKCDPGAEDVPPGTPDREPEIAPRTDGPDHPNCPDREASLAWAQPAFSPGAGWQLSKPVGVGFAARFPGDTLSTFVDERGIWLRKTFSLGSQAQKNELMLWGRWSDGITVYVNGVLASSNSGGTDEYRYLGLSNEARAALVVGGNNVLAVRLEWERYDWDQQGQIVQNDAWDRFFDLGITTEGRLAQVPLQRIVEPNAGIAAYVDTFKEYVQEQGMSGATLAVSKGGTIVASAGLGWHNKNLNVPMPRGAKLRLASNDKIITQAAVTKLVNDGVIGAHEPVFPLLGLDPIPGRSPGANVNQITVEHLRTHTSGIGDTPHDQRALDEVAFEFGISPDQWTKEHNARWMYSVDATDVGGAARYSSNGYFLLRYLVEHLVAPKTLEEYVAEDMGLSGITVSHERLAGREPNEGYITRQPSWDRWMALENYLGLSASAEGYAAFFDDFAMGYELQPDDSYTPAGGGVAGGAMAGTWSIGIEDELRGVSLVMISNNSGNFDEAITRMDQITYGQNPCLFGPNDPRSHLEWVHFIRNVAEPARFINLENGLAASPAMAGWWSAQWHLEPTDPSYFRIKSRWTGEYLHIQSGPLEVGHVDPSLWRAQWQLVYVGGTFQIRNRGEQRYLRVSNGALSASTNSSGNNALWAFCN